MTPLLSTFGAILFDLLSYVVALLVIVFVHELGHYLVGRWTGIKAEVFSLGMGRPLLARTDKHGTRWQLAAIPLGGYVRFQGDKNAASVSTGEEPVDLSGEERRRTLSGAPLWARFLTVAAGPVFNFIFSGVVFAAFLMLQGVVTEPMTVGALKLQYDSGLKSGDVILTINGQTVPTETGWDKFIDQLPKDRAILTYGVTRDGAAMDIEAPHPFPPIISAVSPTSAAHDAGLQKGDVILAINDQPIATYDQLRALVRASGGAALALKVQRQGLAEPLPLTLIPRRTDLPLPDGGFETRYVIGIQGDWSFDPALERPSVGKSAEYGVKQVWWIIKGSVSGMYHMAKGAISACNLRGPIGIAETAGDAAAQGVVSFIWLIAVLSAAIGLMNLFPIPVLDGGHLAFFTYEAITRRKPNGRALGFLNVLGLTVVLALLFFGLLNDFRCG